MKIESVKVDALHVDPANVRTHPERNLEAIKASLAKFGQQKPIVVGPDGVVVAGNGTLEAARSLGWDSINVVRTDLAGAEAVAYAIADNRTGELADWGPELAEVLAGLQGDDSIDHLVAGFTDGEIDELIAGATEPTEVVEDEVPEVPDDPITKPGDLWLLGEHRVMCGDSTSDENTRRLSYGEHADCIFTSPPYGVGISYGAFYDDTLENLRQLLRRSVAQWQDIIVEGGFAVVNFGDLVAKNSASGASVDEVCEYPMAIEHWSAFREAGWFLWSRRVWCKPHARVQAPWCASSNRAASDWEHIWTWKTSGPPIMGRQKQSPQGWVDTTRGQGCDIGKETHGAPMPVALPAIMLQSHSRPHSLVYEPFAGTGTTLIAAEQLDRKCYGLEIEPKYCDVIVARWEKLTGKKADLERSDG